MKTIMNIIYPSLAAIALAFFALTPTAQAVIPAPDGGYPGFNTAEGDNALLNLGTGVANVAVGWYSLFSDSDGSYNTGAGPGTLLFNVSGTANTAIGTAALLFNTADDNTAVGTTALLNNTEGSENTATGVAALSSNTTGNSNTAVGSSALSNNIGGVANTAVGWQALLSNTGNGNSTAVGADALLQCTGFENTALGTNAGVNLTDGVFNIDIGAEVVGVAGESNTIRIGTQGTQTATFVAGISGTAVVGDPVVVDANGQLGTATSSARFKKEIKPMEKASEAILALKPVRFQYKSDSKGIPQFGLIAEEVAKVNPDLVVRDRKGEIYSVRYEAVNAMLLNEFLKEHRKVEQQDRKLQEQESTITQVKSNAAKQEATIALQQQEIKILTASLREQASQIQKVSADLEVTKPVSQTVLNNR